MSFNQKSTGIRFDPSKVNYAEENNTLQSQNNPRQTVDIPVEDFQFTLTHSNKIRPKDIRRMDLNQLVSQNRMEELNDFLSDLSHENFEENDYFDLSRDERKLIKDYQVVMQYMIYSINQLSKKNQILNHYTQQQQVFNEEAEKVLLKQNKKIEDQNDIIQQLTNNCINMEFLIRELGLEDQALTLGLDLDHVEKTVDMKDKNKPLDQNYQSSLRRNQNEFIPPQNNTNEGQTIKYSVESKTLNENYYRPNNQMSSEIPSYPKDAPKTFNKAEDEFYEDSKQEDPNANSGSNDYGGYMGDNNDDEI